MTIPDPRVSTLEGMNDVLCAVVRMSPPDDAIPEHPTIRAEIVG